jgi:hypothetical protein
MGPVKEDPARATLLAILRQLNQAEENNEGKEADQALELGELEQRLADLAPVKQGTIKVSLALGLLLRNGLVVPQRNGGEYSWQRQRDSPQRYQITPEGKKFLLDSIQTSDRIS